MTYHELENMLQDCENALVKYITQYPSSADDLTTKITNIADRIYQIAMQIDYENQQKGAI